MSLAEVAYNGVNNAAIEIQLTEIFVDGLRDDHLKLKLLRDRPDPLNTAITIATNEQNLRKRVSTSGRYGSSLAYGSDMPEPMEVGHYRYKKCQKCRRFGHSADNCRYQGQHENLFQKQRTLQNTNYQEMECWACGKKGHIQRFCRTRQNRSVPDQKIIKSRTFDNHSKQSEN